MSYCSASCTSVRSPLIAAIATFALKADVWFRRGLLLMLSPDSRANLVRCQAEAPLIALCRFPKPALPALAVFSWCTEFWVQQQKCRDADDNESHDKHRHPIVHFPLPSWSMTVEGRANDHQCVL